MKAISLFSGGLDSQVAVCLVKNQDIEVVALNFSSPFFGADQRTRQAARDLGIELLTIDLDQEYVDKVLKNPVYGYGKNINPCIDCHAFMFRKAGDLMGELEASFIITGEVVGQRPMSQNKSALNAVDKLSGYRGYIVRPLSAKILPPTIPEKEGWIERDLLENINGRGRSRQMELAETFGIHDYPSPAGGCLLTEQGFARRLKKLLQVKPHSQLEDMHIMKLGRHFYLNDCLLVIGRNHSENEKLEQLTWPTDYLFKVADRPGPLGLLRSMAQPPSGEDLKYAAALVARYSDAKNEPVAAVKIIVNSEIKELLEIKPLAAEEVLPPI